MAIKDAHRNVKINFLILGITILFGLLLMELLFRLLPPPRIGWGTTRAPKAKIYGWAGLPNYKMIFRNPDTDETSYFTTNSQGWKDIEHEFEKPEGIIRIIVLGDSTTWGRVMPDDLYTWQTEHLLKGKGFSNIEVITMGMGGWGTDQILEALQVEGIKYHPDFIIYQFSNNDILDNLKPLETTEPESIHWEKRFKYKLEDGTLRKIKSFPEPKPMPTARKMKKFLMKSILFRNVKVLVCKIDIVKYLRRKRWWSAKAVNPLTTHFRHSSIEQTETLQEEWELFEALIVKMKLISEKNNAKFIIFTDSGEKGIRTHYLKWNVIKTDGLNDFVIWDGKKYPIDLERPLKNLRRTCKKHKIPLIEPKREYDRYHYDAHPSQIGNMRMAQDIVEFLISWEPFYANRYRH